MIILSLSLFPNFLQPINPRRVVTIPPKGRSWYDTAASAYRFGRRVIGGVRAASNFMNAYSRWRNGAYRDAFEQMYNGYKAIDNNFWRVSNGAYRDGFLEEYDHHGYEPELFSVC